MQADDWQASPTVTVCQTDVAEHCSHVEHGSGRVHACLASHLHSDQLSHACLMAELKQQVATPTHLTLLTSLILLIPLSSLTFLTSLTSLPFLIPLAHLAARHGGVLSQPGPR